MEKREERGGGADTREVGQEMRGLGGAGDREEKEGGGGLSRGGNGEGLKRGEGG